MSRIDFYHLQRQSLVEILPKLLQKVLSSDKRAFIKVGSSDEAEKLNTALWTYDEESFLPHGSKKEGFAAQQPVWLDIADNNANGAEFLFLVNGAEIESDKINEFERVINIFDGKEEKALQQARNLWIKYKEAGNEVHYWQQTASGKWEQKM